MRWFVLLAACACGSVDPAPEPPPCRPAEPSLPGVVFDDAGDVVSVAPDFRLVVERWRCLGPCPQFSFTLTADGSGTYAGTLCVEDAGPHQLSVEPSEWRGFLRRLGPFAVPTLQGCYDASVAELRHYEDASGYTMTVSAGGTTTTFMDSFGYGDDLAGEVVPDWILELRRLTFDLDRAAGVVDYVGQVMWGDTGSAQCPMIW